MNIYIFFGLQGENMVVAVDDDGCFTEKITDFSGRYVKDADKDIIETVKVRLFYFCLDKDTTKLICYDSDYIM